MASQRILVVDDDPAIAGLNRELLALAGYAADSCSRPAEALQRICAGGYDALLTDLDLGGRGDEFILAGALKQMQPRAGVLLLTGLPDFEHAWRAIQSCVDGVLVKPVDPAALRTAVQVLVSRERPRARENLGEFIAAHHDEIIAAWLRQAEADPMIRAIRLPREQRVDDLEQVLEDIAAHIRTPSGPPLRNPKAANRHGRLRRAQGYSAVSVLREATLLRQTITELALRRFLEVDPARFLPDLLAMHSGVDEAALRSLAAFGAR